MSQEYEGGKFPEPYKPGKWRNITEQFEVERKYLFSYNEWSDMTVNIMMYRAMRCIPYAIHFRNNYSAFCRCYMGVIFRSALNASTFQADDYKVEYKKGKMCSVYSPEFDGRVKEREFADYYIAKQNVKYGYDYWDLRHRDTGNRPWGCTELFEIEPEEPYIGYRSYVQACIEILNHGTFRSGGFDPALHRLFPMMKSPTWNQIKDDSDMLERLLNFHMLWQPNNSEIWDLCGWGHCAYHYQQGLEHMAAGDEDLYNNILEITEKFADEIVDKHNSITAENWRDWWSQGIPINVYGAKKYYEYQKTHWWKEWELGETNWNDPMTDEKKEVREYRFNPLEHGQIEVLERCNKVLDIIGAAVKLYGNKIWDNYATWSEDLNFESLPTNLKKPGLLTVKKLAYDMEQFIDYFDAETGWSARSMSGATQKYQWTKLPKERVEHLLGKHIEKSNYDPDWEEFNSDDIGAVNADKTCEAHAELEFMRHCVAGCDGLPPMLNNRGKWEPRSARMCKSVEAAHTTIALKAVILQACNIFITYFEGNIRDKMKESKGKEKQGWKTFFDTDKHKDGKSLYYKNRFQPMMINHLIQIWNKSPYIFLPLGNGHWFVDAFDQVVETFKVQGWGPWIAKNGIPYMYRGASLPAPLPPSREQTITFWAELVTYAVYGGKNPFRVFWMPTPSNQSICLYPLCKDYQQELNKNADGPERQMLIQIIMNPYYAKEIGQEIYMDDLFDETKNFKVLPKQFKRVWIEWKDNVKKISDDYEDEHKLEMSEDDMNLWSDLDEVHDLHVVFDGIMNMLPKKSQYWQVDINMTKFDPSINEGVDKQACERLNTPYEKDTNWLKTYWIRRGFDLKYKGNKNFSVLLSKQNAMNRKGNRPGREILPLFIPLSQNKGNKDDSDGLTCFEKYMLPFHEKRHGTTILDKMSIVNILTKYSPDEKFFRQFRPKRFTFTGKGVGQHAIGVKNIIEILCAYDRWYVQHYLFMEIAVRGKSNTLGMGAYDPYRGLDRYKRNNYKRKGKLKFNNFTSDLLRMMKILPRRNRQPKQNYFLEDDEIDILWDKYHDGITPLGPFFLKYIPARGAENMMLPIVGIPARYYDFEPRRLAIGFFEAIQEVASSKDYYVELEDKWGAPIFYNPAPRRGNNEKEATYIIKPVRTFVSARGTYEPWKRGEWTSYNLKANTKVNCQPTNVCYYIGEKDGEELEKEPWPMEQSTNFPREQQLVTHTKQEKDIGFIGTWLDTYETIGPKQMNDCVWYYSIKQAQSLAQVEPGKSIQLEPHPLCKIAWYYVKASERWTNPQSEMDEDEGSEVELLKPMSRLKF